MWMSPYGTEKQVGGPYNLTLIRGFVLSGLHSFDFLSAQSQNFDSLHFVKACIVFMGSCKTSTEDSREKEAFPSRIQNDQAPQATLLSFHRSVLMEVVMRLPMAIEITTTRAILCPSTDNRTDSAREFALLSGSDL